MPHTRTSYHREVKTASLQGRTITVENLTPILAPKVRNRRKREIEAGPTTFWARRSLKLPGLKTWWKAPFATVSAGVLKISRKF